MSKINYNKEINHIIDVDVAVLGGGPAGFAAATAAARNGAKVLIVERTGMLGGMSTAGLVGPFMTCYDTDEKERIVGGVFEEVFTKAAELGGAITPDKIHAPSTYSSYFGYSHSFVTPQNGDILQIVYDDILESSGAKLLYYTDAVDVVAKDGIVDYVILYNKDGLSAVRAKIFIDCTGDADIAVEAGAGYVMGDKETGKMQPISLFFEISGVDREKYMSYVEKMREKDGRDGCFAWLVEEGRKSGEWDLSKEEIAMYETCIPGRFKVNCTRISGVDGTKTEDLTLSHIEGRRQALKIFNFVKKHVPGCENIMLVQFASNIGVRETRHVETEKVLDVKDICNTNSYEDAIATFAFKMDMHAPEGGGYVPLQDIVRHWYTIPYGCLLPKGLKNVLVAGRTIGATSLAASSLRCMPAAMATGQAAGTAAAMAVSEDKCPADIDRLALKEKLRADGAIIK